jgi:GT2 family glycosyltransferase
MSRSHLAKITGVKGRTVFGRLSSTNGKPISDPLLGVLLNGEAAGFSRLMRGQAGKLRNFRFALPADRIASTLEIISVTDGRPLLPQPFDLSAYYQLRMGPLALDGLKIRGHFTLAPKLDEFLFVQLARDRLPINGVHAKRVKLTSAGFAYEFEAALPSLAALEQPYALSALVAGAAAESAASLKIDFAAVGIVGYVERADGNAVTGWACNLRDHGRPVTLELLALGAVVRRVQTTELRNDVAPGLRMGPIGFTLPFDDQEVAGCRTLSVVISGGSVQLVNSPIVLRARSQLVGHFDGFDGRFAVGWAGDLDAPGSAVEVEVVCEGRVLVADFTRLDRKDVQAAGFPLSACGFRIDLGEGFRDCVRKEVSARIKGLDCYLEGSPKVPQSTVAIQDFLERSRQVDGLLLGRLRRHLNFRARGSSISLVMPVYNPKIEWLIEALDSAKGQWCDNWELICVDDASTQPAVPRLLASYAKADHRIKVLSKPHNSGIAAAVNLGIQSARFGHIAFLDHDDVLEPDAVYRMICAINEANPDLIYSDELVSSSDVNTILDVRSRPAFSYDYYLSHPYFVHLVCVRTDIGQRVGGWNERMSISADVDFVLRVIEQAKRIAHVPAVLYRWRTHETSAGHSRMGEVFKATGAAIRAHLERLRIPGKVRRGLGFNQFRIDWPNAEGAALIVIRAHGEMEGVSACIECLERTAAQVEHQFVIVDHNPRERQLPAQLRHGRHRYPVIRCLASAQAVQVANQVAFDHGRHARFLLFLRDDLRATEPGWLERLCSLASRQEVGIVGPLIVTEKGTIESAGMLVGLANGLKPVMKEVEYLQGSERNPGYNGTLTSVRDFSAVSADCFVIRRELFRILGGLDQKFTFDLSGPDLCLRAREKGFKVIYDGFTVLRISGPAAAQANLNAEREGAALFQRRWSKYFSGGDPFYNPNLDPEGKDHVLRENGCKHNAPARVCQINE